MASFAVKSAASKGRIYNEPEHDYRSCYQRDRDRVIHSTAFRRLEYKTQVFVNHEGDYYRTRLTHTLEATQLARTIARSLGLNEDLVETISLAHDIGHPPFGHAGETALKELMKEKGGFEHNRQGLRVVDRLEKRYPDFDGLNLTWEVREGINKHFTAFDKTEASKEFAQHAFPTLEAQVADVADEIAYDNHDLDDGLTSGLLQEEELDRVELWHIAKEQVLRKEKQYDPEIHKYQIIRYLINWQIIDVITESCRRLKEYNIQSPEEAKNCSVRIISFSSDMFRLRKPLEAFLLENLYHHYRVVRMSDKARRFVKDLFELYVAKPAQLPPGPQKRLKAGGEDEYVVVCDYIAGMTDRFALDEHKKLFEPYEKV